MGTIIIGALVTAMLSLIGSRIAMWRARVWLAENKHKVKWEIIYTIFGPDPNRPPVVVPPVPERRRPILDWWRRGRKISEVDQPPRQQDAPSLAERAIGSLEFHVGFVLVSVPMALVAWTFSR